MSDVDAREQLGTNGTTIIRIPAPGSRDISLGVLEKRCERVDLSFPPVLLVHGATFGAALFDLPLPGYSLMSALASTGRYVYAIDVRGFGNSLHGAVMDAPPNIHPPFPKLGEAVRDIGAAVDLIRTRENAEVVDIVGFSWGTITSACYAVEQPRRIARLVLYAPLYGEANTMWLDRIADPKDPTRINRIFGAYRWITQADVTGRWDGDLPTREPGLYREDGLPEAVFESLAALDPRSRVNGRRALRCPTGALVDLVSVFNGRPLYDPARIETPTLLIRGADDTTSTDSDARRLLAGIASTEKAYRVVKSGLAFPADREKSIGAIRTT